MNSAPSGDANRIAVLMYHRIGDAGNVEERRYSVSPRRFESHMLALERCGMQPCSIEGFFDWLEGRRVLAHGSFVLTFDDGFLGTYEHAFPVLARMQWPAAVFLVSSLIGKTSLWAGREDPRGRHHPLLGQREIFDMMRGGFSFHSHSRTHADLTALPRDMLLAELAGSQRDLENLLGPSIRFLAYPHGKHDENVIEAARACGYKAAFSVQPGFNRQDVDRYRVRRIDVYGTDSAAALLRKMRFGTNDGSWTQSLRYYASRVGALPRGKAQAG